MKKDTKITIIGGGNMGHAIANGLVRSNTVKAADITITRHSSERLDDLLAQGYKASHDNALAVRGADFVLLAVKPYLCKEVLDGFAAQLDKKKQTLISIVAMVSVEDLEKMAGNEIVIARIIPNTAIDLCQSMNCISTNRRESAQFTEVVSMFSHLGEVVVMEEKTMDAAMALTSCGTAYFLRMIRAAEQGAVHIGIHPKTAQKMAAQTALGAAALVLREGAAHTEAEIDKVTTAGGITIKGLNEMERNGLSSSIIQGIVASYDVMKGKK